MRKSIAAVVVAGALIASAAGASAQSDTVVGVIKIGAWAQVLAEKCPELQVDWSRYGTMMTMAGLRPGDIEPGGKHGQLHGAFIREAINETERSSKTVACASGRSLYGPKGRNMPNLLVPKS